VAASSAEEGDRTCQRQVELTGRVGGGGTEKLGKDLNSRTGRIGGSVLTWGGHVRVNTDTACHEAT
jgi:hypothetical protein